MLESFLQLKTFQLHDLSNYPSQLHLRHCIDIVNKKHFSEWIHFLDKTAHRFLATNNNKTDNNYKDYIYDQTNDYN